MLQCPHCQHSAEPSVWPIGEGTCPNCQQAIVLEVSCPDCQQPLQVLRACGAINLFCPSCNLQVSKRSAHWALRAA